MNNEEKTTVREEAATEEPSAKTPSDETTPRRKRSKSAIAIACAVIFVALYAIVNISVFANLFSGLLSIISPILIGAAIAYLLNPILKFFEFVVFKRIRKKSVVRGLSLVLTYVVAALLIVAFLLLIIPQLVDSIMRFTENFTDVYLPNTTRIINNFIHWVMGKSHTPYQLDEQTLLNTVTGFLNRSGDLLESLLDYAVQYGAGLFVGLKNTLLGIFISIYMLAAKERLLAQAKKLVTALFSPKGKKRVYRYARLCDRTFGGFFIGVIIDAFIVGILTFVTLSIFQIEYAILVAFIVGMTNVIPFFGPFIGAIPSFLIIFIANPADAFLFLVLILIIQQIDGNVIAPKILGNTTGISSLGVIISITVMGDLFGLVGMLIGVPLFAVIVMLVKEFIDYRLTKKSLSTDTADYYEEDSLVDPHETHTPVAARLFRGIGHTVVRMLRHRSKEEKQRQKELRREKKAEPKKKKKKEIFGEEDPD